MLTNDINIRDPYILSYNGWYYLYGMRSETCWGEAYGFDCYKSEDLNNWEGPYEIFTRPADFFATNCYWAPECYEYNGEFFLLTTFGAPHMKKGIYLLRSNKPDGPFTVYGNRLTPESWCCIDGTLYFEEGHVFLIYSHSFEDTPDADICIQELSQDLKQAISEPQTLFLAKEAPWAKPVPFAEAEFGMSGDVYFSDGPCVFSNGDGKLYMTWSSWSKGSYAVGAAVSDCGQVKGPWRQQTEPVWPENGGHGMVFHDTEGKLAFVFHYPNDKTKERPCIKKLTIKNGMLKLADR